MNQDMQEKVCNEKDPKTRLFVVVVDDRWIFESPSNLHSTNTDSEYEAPSVAHTCSGVSRYLNLIGARSMQYAIR